MLSQVLRAEGAKPGSTVLVCDDERHIVRLIQVNLERQGHRVLTACDGTQAIDILRTDQVNVLVIDGDLTWPMPTSEVIEEMRCLPGGEEVQVIVLRSKDGPPPSSGIGVGPNSGPPPFVMSYALNPAEVSIILQGEASPET